MENESIFISHFEWKVKITVDTRTLFSSVQLVWYEPAFRLEQFSAKNLHHCSFHISIWNKRPKSQTQAKNTVFVRPAEQCIAIETTKSHHTVMLATKIWNGIHKTSSHNGQVITYNSQTNG